MTISFAPPDDECRCCKGIEFVEDNLPLPSNVHFPAEASDDALEVSWRLGQERLLCQPLRWSGERLREGERREH